jgi:hypothetical protein
MYEDERVDGSGGERVKALQVGFVSLVFLT